MPIQIIQEDERLIYELAGSKIIYRRLSTMKRGGIIRKHTKRGKPDWNAATAEMLQQIIIGWENVQARGKGIPFDAELALRLPEDVLSDILTLAGGTAEDDEGEGAEKNLEISSSGN